MDCSLVRFTITQFIRKYLMTNTKPIKLRAKNNSDITVILCIFWKFQSLQFFFIELEF